MAEAHAHFSKSEAIKVGWDIFKKNALFLIGVVLVSGIISWIFSYLQSEVQGTDVQAFSPLISIASFIVNMAISVGVVRITLGFVDGKKPQFKELFDNFNMTLVHVILGSIIYGIIVFLGLLALVIPGIYLALKYQFYMYLIIDKKMGPIEAIKESGKITKGEIWNLLLFSLLMFGVMIIGLLALIIGILAAYPVIMVAVAYVYRTLSKRLHSAKE